MKLSVVIPAHNEEQNIERIVKLLFKNFNKEIYECIIVNDCSTDRTGELLEKLTNKYKKIISVHRKGDNGVGNAILDGLRKVSKNAEYILMLDCDFIENIANISTMLKQTHTADGLLGSRYIRKDSLINYPIMKKIANRAFHKIARISLQFPQKDVTNNFKLYKREIIEKILPLLKSKGFSINAETGIYPILLGYSLREIPVVWIGRTKDMGKSNFNVLKAGPGYIRVLFDAIKLKYFPSHTHISLQHTEARHFDALIEQTGETYYGNLRPIAKVRFSRKADAIIKQIHNIPDPKILELGCGTGILSRYLLEKNPYLRIEGIDISPKAIQIAKNQTKKYQHAHFQCGDGLNLPFKGNAFDFVIGNSILHHIPLQRSLEEILRVLKPRGEIWFCEPNMLNPQIAVEKNIPILKSFFQDSPDEKAFSRWGIRKDLQKIGFTNVTVTPFEFLHPLIPEKTFFFMIPFCLLLEKIPLINEFAGTMSITAKKGKSVI